MFFRVFEFDSSNQEVNFENLPDILTKQLIFKCGTRNFVLTIQIWPAGLVKIIKKLAQHYELVIFTILPEQAIKAIIENLVPELKEYFPVILSNENLQEEESSDFYFKDIGLLACNRMQDSNRNVFCIDTEDYSTHVD